VKISHRDFRPQRRSRYVNQPPKRRPTLRILLLAGIALAVYVKFDSVIASPSFQKLRHPERMFSGWGDAAPDAAKPVSIALRWAVDSAYAEAECQSPRFDSCLANLDGMDPEALGSLRAALQKVALQWNFNDAGGYTARFTRSQAGADLLNPGGSALELSRLELRPGRGAPAEAGSEHGASRQERRMGGMLVLNKSGVPGETKGMLCDGTECLDATHPLPPFPLFRKTAAVSMDASRIPQADFLPIAGTAAKAVLPGRIVELPSDPGKEWMKIYHGANIFSYYRGFTRMRPGRNNGSLVNAQDTLGFVEVPDAEEGGITVSDASERGLEVRIEKDGLFIDPLAWLGLQDRPGDTIRDSEAGTAHGR
jgi:hypothetical protein